MIWIPVLLALGVVGLVASSRKPRSASNKPEGDTPTPAPSFSYPSPGSGISNYGPHGQWDDTNFPVAIVFSDSIYDRHLSQEYIYLGVPVHEAPNKQAEVTLKLRHKAPIRIDINNQNGTPRGWVRIYHSYYPEQNNDYSPEQPQKSGEFVTSGYVEYKYLCDIRQLLPFCPDQQ